MTFRKNVPLPTGIQPYTFSSGNCSTLHPVGDLGHHQSHQTISSPEKRTHREVGWVVPRTVSSHSMNVTVEMSNTPPQEYNHWNDRWRQKHFGWGTGWPCHTRGSGQRRDKGDDRLEWHPMRELPFSTKSHFNQIQKALVLLFPLDTTTLISNPLPWYSLRVKGSLAPSHTALHSHVSARSPQPQPLSPSNGTTQPRQPLS